MDDSRGVQVRDGGDDLSQITRRLLRGQLAALLHDVRERLVAAEFHEDVHVRGVLEAPRESHDVRVSHRTMDANFRQDFRARAFLLERRLGDNLAGYDRSARDDVACDVAYRMVGNERQMQMRQQTRTKKSVRLKERRATRARGRVMGPV